jgi:hypothetical protein
MAGKMRLASLARLALLAAALAVPGLAWPDAATAAPALGAIPAADAALPGRAPEAGEPRRADFLGEKPTPAARRVADWAVASHDHAALPFVIIDKVSAKLFVFDATGTLQGSSMALLGFAHGDDTVPGIGTRKLAAILPEERTTPAGRFVAQLGHDLKTDILWVDYDAAISLHRVVRGNPGDRRQQRLTSISPMDNRITYGCINVPSQFYNAVVLKVFSSAGGIVYILPERRKLEDVFPLGRAAAPGDKR